MNAVALVIPQFPSTVRSDTYAIDYGRALGAEWMARSAELHAPAGPMTLKAKTEFIAVIETRDEDDFAVRVRAQSMTEATDLAWAWVDANKVPASDVWINGTRADVEDSWGDQSETELIN